MLRTYNTIFLWVLIGWLDCSRPLWLAKVITLVFWNSVWAVDRFTNLWDLVPQNSICQLSSTEITEDQRSLVLNFRFQLATNPRHYSDLHISVVTSSVQTFRIKTRMTISEDKQVKEWILSLSLRRTELFLPYLIAKCFQNQALSDCFACFFSRNTKALRQ